MKNTKQHLIAEIESLLERATPDQLKIILRLLQNIIK